VFAVTGFHKCLENAGLEKIYNSPYSFSTAKNKAFTTLIISYTGTFSQSLELENWQRKSIH